VPPLALAVKLSGTPLEPDDGPATETVSEPPGGGVGAGVGVGAIGGETATGRLCVAPLTVTLREHDPQALAGVQEIGVLASAEKPIDVVPEEETRSH
jgi:hypothetical protein